MYLRQKLAKARLIRFERERTRITITGAESLLFTRMIQ